MVFRFNYEGYSYVRFFCNKLTKSMAQELKHDYDYVYAVAYDSIDDADFGITKKKSAIIPLSESIDDIFSRFHSTTRNEIRRSFKDKNLEVKDKIKDWNNFYLFHKSCENERGWLPVPIEELKESLIISVKYSDEYISAYSCYEGEKVLRVDRIFSGRKSPKFDTLKNVIFSSSSRRIVYELCKIGINKGCKFLDLGGVDVNDPLKRGISAFKMKFGSHIIPVTIGRYYKNKLKFENNSKANGVDIL